ncbi:hypothetical protein CYLTODRAFT_158342 [Cylindrobasidium torrendii FP15055 ss-10]|uniref:Uncharacterized protein n=1 Tax=Cylindrobasidium torrendii FP15055 ss-10 TaxID=1314674 RepID=A0A0D7BN59_9AGAR|nr:hypothetical protein CYLTODRAFT_158342 [Cylindrobasidium torrendii FP15055 ss-10]
MSVPTPPPISSTSSQPQWPSTQHEAHSLPPPSVPATASPFSTAVPCNGAFYEWHVGCTSLTYPHGIHSEVYQQVYNALNPGFDFLAPHSPLTVSHSITVRSHRCTGFMQYPWPSGCQRCSSLGSNVARVEFHASAPPTTQHPYSLSIWQHMQRFENQTETLNETKLEERNDQRDLATRTRQRDAYVRLHRLIATNNMPALQALFENADKQGWATETFIEKAHDCLLGRYNPHNFKKYLRDLSTYIYEIGGNPALYALNHAVTRFPSRWTIAPNRQDCLPRVSVTALTIVDMLSNLRTALAQVKPPSRRGGVTYAQDETACERRLCWDPTTDSIVGLCHHARRLTSLKVGEDMGVIDSVVKGLRVEKDIHCAHEMSVGVFGLHSARDYSARPAFLLPTCKTGLDMFDAAHEIAMALAAWRMCEVGARRFGDVWILGSDGDAKRRAALYLVTMIRKLVPADPIFPYLAGIPGMNLYCGQHFETASIDWKHTFKRVCTLFSSAEGLLVADVIVTKTLLTHWFERIPGGYNWTHSGASPSTLFNFGDHQDVPRAVTILALCGELREIDEEKLDPAERHAFRALRLLGEVTSAVVNPFICLEMSLFDQMKSLAKFMYLSFALYSIYGSSFFSDHLYGDLQSIAQGAFFVLAHSKVVGPDSEVFISLCGSDIVEVLFGRTRMLGGHNPNFDSIQMRHQVGSALRISELLADHPEWEPKARRLDTRRMRAVDHGAPRHQTGNRTAGSCDPVVAAMSGLKEAEDCLEKCENRTISSFSILDALRQPNTDLRRPHGKGYPGLSKSVDCAVQIAAAKVDEMLGRDSEVSSSQWEKVSEEQLVKIHDITTFDGDKQLAQELAESESESTAPPSPWLYLDNEHRQRVHKKRALREATSPGYDLGHHDSHDRLRRVHTGEYSAADDWDRSLDPISSTHHDAFGLNGLFATLVSIESHGIALAIAQCFGIRSREGCVTAVPFDEVSLVDSTYELLGQILDLRPHVDDNDQLQWAWNSESIELESVKKAKSANGNSDKQKGRENLKLSVNGSITRPLRRNELTDIDILDLAPSLQALLGPSNQTWSFSETHLKELEIDLIARMGRSKELCELIPVRRVRSGAFPYACSLGNESHVRHVNTAISVPLKQDNAKRPCFVCGASIKGSMRYTHIARHIIHKKRGMAGNERVAVHRPCGYCARAGTCTISVERGFPKSNCPEYHRFRIHAASVSTASNPATNVPIACVYKACGETDWKYNMLEHLEDRHPSWRTVLGSEEREDFLAKISISEAEEIALGVPPNLVGKDAVLQGGECVTPPTSPRCGTKRLPDSLVAMTPSRRRPEKSART